MGISILILPFIKKFIDASNPRLRLLAPTRFIESGEEDHHNISHLSKCRHRSAYKQLHDGWVQELGFC